MSAVFQSFAARCKGTPAASYDSSDNGSNSEDDSALAPVDLCRDLPPSLKRTFDDLDALECGDAREFIPRELMNPCDHWTECTLTRDSKTSFYLHIDQGEHRPRFALSAKRVGSDFFISRYEAFPTEQEEHEVPVGRFCAVLTKVRGRRSCEYKLCPVTEDETIGHISHSSIIHAESKAEIRTVEALIPEPTKEGVDCKYVWDYSAGGAAVPVRQAGAGGDVHASKRALASGEAQTPTTAGAAPQRRASIPHATLARGAGSEVGGANGSVHVASMLPAWDPANKCLTMKFLRNRVRQSSTKNCVVYRSEDLPDHAPRARGGAGGGHARSRHDRAILQLGKFDVKGDRSFFVLDFRAPVAPLQAFAIALSSFAYKPN